MQKYFEYIGIISLICFSLFITERTTMIAKDMDNIMIQIKNNYKNYELISKDATIDNDTIKTGICSKKVNINKSYNEMKKVGLYDEYLYQYEYKLPKVNISNNYDKYVIGGNEFKNYVYLFINLNNRNKNLLNNYLFINYNFIVTEYFYINNYDLIKQLISNGNSILIMSSSFEKYKEVSKHYYEKYNKKIFCFSFNKNKKILDMCSGNNSNTILIDSNIYLYNLLDIKPLISRGNFINISLNDNLINNIELLEKYISQKGISKGNVDDNLREC